MRAAVSMLALLACTSDTPDPPATGETDDTVTDTVPDDTVPDDTVPDDSGDPAPTGATLALGDAIACADPQLRVDQPLTELDGGDDWAAQPFDPTETTLFTGGGVTVLDFDGDGRRDILNTGVNGATLFLQNDDGTFDDVSETHLPGLAERSVAFVPADVEGDGDIDLFVARYKRADRLWENQGDGVFRPFEHSADVAGTDADKSVSGAFADVDGDGDLDLMVTVYGAMYSTERGGEPSRLYENIGDARFVDRSDGLPPEVQAGFSFNTAWQDLDGDDLPELYVVNDHGEVRRNSLVWNRGDWEFEVDDNYVGLDVRLQGMGLAIADFNHDEIFDFAVAGWGNNRLMVSRGGFWADQHQGAGFDGVGARNQAVGWGPASGDLDNDGNLDLYLGFGAIHNQSTPQLQPDELFLSTGGVDYQRAASVWGFVENGQTRGVLLVDLDGDGWLDVIRKDLVGPTTIHMGRCGDAAWLEIALDQPGPNPRGVGATVTVRSDDDVWMDAVRAGGTSVFSAGPQVVHVGLGDEETVSLEVRWPDGAVDVFEDVPTRRHVTVHR